MDDAHQIGRGLFSTSARRVFISKVIAGLRQGLSGSPTIPKIGDDRRTCMMQRSSRTYFAFDPRCRHSIDAFAHLYNHHRPHGALGGQAPYEYLTRTSQEIPPSQMY